MSYTPAGSPNLFFSGLAVSGISGYKQLAKPPMTAAAEVELTQAVVDTDGEVLMEEWVSPALGLAEIAAGTWSFLVYGNVDTVDGASEIVMRVYSRNAAGSETELFDVTTGDLTGSPAAYAVTSSQAVLALSALTDRLVVKFFAKTTSTGTRTVHLYYLGEARQSRMSLPVELAIVPGGDMLASLYDADQDGQIGGSGGGHVIQDEGTDLPAQVNLNFKGAGVTVTNNPETGATDAEIPGATVDPWITSVDTWTYSSADSPTFVISINADLTGLIGVGYRIRLTQTTVKYFIVTAVGAYSGGATLITVYGGTDYTLVDAAISSPSYSYAKVPHGFPMNPNKWTVEATGVTNRIKSGPTQNVWYNLNADGSIVVPIGLWKVSYQVACQTYNDGIDTTTLITLSTANNSESDVDFTAAYEIYGEAGMQFIMPTYREKVLSLASKTTYYLNSMTPLAGIIEIRWANDKSKMIIRAQCAYL